jgi:archaemetzincin
VRRNGSEASSNGRTADFGSAYEGSNPSASANSGTKPANLRAEVRPLPRPSHVLLVALGTVSPRLVQAAGEALRETLDMGAKIGPSLDRPQYAYNKDRGQYHATSILRRLASLRAQSAPVVGVLDVDLFLPDAPYVIGDADRDAGAAVFSLARLSHADPDKVKRRAQVETVHGAGHLLGLSHCTDFRCAMFFSRDAADSDRKGPGLCASCRAALGLPPR